MPDAQRLQHARRELAILAAGNGERTKVRGAAHQDEVEHCEGEVAGVALRHVAYATRDLAARQRSERHAVERDAAAVRLQKAEDGAEERGLAAAIRAEHAHRFPGGEREADVPAHRVARKPERKMLNLQRHQLRRARANSHRKNGVPMSAVSTPGGTSIVAIVRQSVSTPRRNAAPRSMASGSNRPKSGPTSSRAACGMSSPTQPMIPLTATAAAVIKVAAATISVRSLPVSAPRAPASSSGSARRFMRQRRSSIGARPAIASGAAAARSRGAIAARLPSSQ